MIHFTFMSLVLSSSKWLELHAERPLTSVIFLSIVMEKRVFALMTSISWMECLAKTMPPIATRDAARPMITSVYICLDQVHCVAIFEKIFVWVRSLLVIDPFLVNYLL